ncbi:MAG: SURF1 family protein [Methylococcales bacterium]|jgi:surfeit locus 1 family protein|nr:SURF1 family protein [Methylococcales bacterium]MBT7410681.1 SURF1 family protein [Methylococcales bacterium]
MLKRFKFSFVLTILVSIAITLFVSLGFWQLDRADEKQFIADSIQNRNLLETINLNLANQTLDEQMAFRNVVAEGVLLHQDFFFLDNKLNKGRPGYHIIVPMKLKATNQYVLIDQGWVYQGKDRRVLPKISINSNDVIVHGKLKRPSVPPIKLDQEQTGKLQLFINIEQLQEKLGYTLLPLIIMQSPDDDFGFKRKEIKFNNNKGMHLGYAIQWFAFAFFSIIIYTYLSYRREKDEQ